ncbi:sugar ABC transporter substrate-binding protein [Streptomyces luteolifulvus]|jgi:sorbitol/mannitol transport system substrate-binding protein|uniref:Sugar ABC transporter substrate-binding protein n=1 Tax=Streptomyces luteolifulvus TaxID=2615112 RepID=A0A6H9UYZ1_9ACTN|nr:MULTISPECIES: sugar ABC transporter substrate-binding protein [Streptomyces]KAB1144776.1 sugar ABC transporter substrate-binding protein [Streptomyces luteolifulvus]MXM65821.1 extracellular solute-binding protein [Streptomyces sp. HUCO-GS316]
MHTRPSRARLTTAALTGLTCTALLAGCAGAGGSGGDDGGKTVNVLMVNNPQMIDLQKLTKDQFTKKTGIKVNFTVLPENEVRDKITQDVATQAGTYDVVTVGAYEVPLWAKNGWLSPMDDTVAKDASFKQDDVFTSMTDGLRGEDGKLYAEPFYGESSFLMYRKDVFEAKNLTMPDRPTWKQVADLAAKVDGAEKGMKGICLRGKPGWGELGASLTTVVNTEGGTWFTKDWQAQVDGEGFAKAAEQYVDLVRKHGEAGAPQAGFAECLNNFTQEKTAMWMDATSAAGLLEDPESPVAGKVGYAQAPVTETKASGWLWTWALAQPKAGKHQDAGAEFVKWAASQEYEQLVGDKLGWARVPAGKRKSTYDNPEYQKAAGPFYQATLTAISEADPRNPGTQPRPTVGVQYVTIPEFQDLGTKVTQEISAAIAGRQSVSDALDKGQKLAEQVAAKYRNN